MTAKQVHVIGIAVVDALSGPILHYPVPVKYSQIVTKNVRFMAGGGAVNTASALGQMGIPTSVFSKVGKDPKQSLLFLKNCHKS